MIYVTGDLHGDASRLSAAALSGLKSGDTLIICGDFGLIWTGSQKENKLLHEVAGRSYNICFIDGTHENFDLLNAYDVCKFCGGKAHKIGKNLYHLMRGQVFSIEGKNIFVMGGGESPDIELRAESAGYFAAETPSKAEFLEAAANLMETGYKVDYIITHEPPSKTKSFLQKTQSTQSSINITNAFFDEILQKCSFDKWYFGSLHCDKAISESQFALFTNIRNCETGKIL